MNADPRVPLREAQVLAERLFDAIESADILRPGVTESAASERIHDLAAREFGGPRWWHRRVVRFGANTLCPYQDHPPDLTLGEDDIGFVDLGPVFDGWEADFARTYVVGDDPRKHRIREAVFACFEEGQEWFAAHEDCTGASLYARMREIAIRMGYEFGGTHSGHLIGEFPHQKIPGDKLDSYIHPANRDPLRGHFADGTSMTWILESHLVDRERGYGAFYEALLDG